MMWPKSVNNVEFDFKFIPYSNTYTIKQFSFLNKLLMLIYKNKIFNLITDVCSIFVCADNFLPKRKSGINIEKI